MKYICAVLVIVVAAGCATTCDPLIVKVPVDNPGAELPLADLPEWKTPSADPSIPSTYLQALVHDLIAAWAVIVEDRHTIEAHNNTIAADETQ